MFYNLLTGTVPFKAGNRVELMRMVVNNPPTPISTYLPDLPHWCGKLIDKALAKAPNDRFQTAEEFRSALTTAIGSATGIPARKLQQLQPYLKVRRPWSCVLRLHPLRSLPP